MIPDKLVRFIKGFVFGVGFGYIIVTLLKSLGWA